MTTTDGPRRSRTLLYLPFVLLGLIALGWTGFWFYVRGEVAKGVDAALANEVQAGRNWTCVDRGIAGFPFRIELRCARLALTSTRWGDAVRIETGPAVFVGQIYSPGLVIAEITAPLTATLPEGRRLDLGWSRLQASLAHASGDPRRLSLAVADATGALSIPGQPNESWRAAAVEAHWRNDPDRPAAEEAVDIAISARGTVIPALDALLGTTETGDLALQSVVTRASAFRAGFNPDVLETWRNGGGQVELASFRVLRGKARIEATGRLLLDQTRRVSGQISAGVAGIDRIAGVPIGGIAAGLGGLGALFGGKPAPSGNDASGLTQLPPLVLREGRVLLGPLALPIKPLPPLY